MSFQLLIVLCCAFTVRSAHKHRAEQLRRMRQYQLIHLNPLTVDQDTKSLEFDAFGHHYAVEITRKPLSAPSLVVHSNVDYEDHAPLSSNNESCHFSGRVLSDRDSVVSFSLCDGRGIRGRITAFGETLVLKPSAFYLDLDRDRMADHALDDELLMYRLSDFETPEAMDDGAAALSEDGAAALSDGDDVGHFMERRRLYTGYDQQHPAETEMAIMIGPVRTANYKEDYGDNWYSQLFLDTADLVNSVDEIYSNTDWNAGGRHSIGGKGSVRVVLSEIHIVHEFSGQHYSLRPDKEMPDDCGLGDDEFSDNKWCYVNGFEWLYKVRRWVSAHFETRSYDNVQFLTDISFHWDACPWYAMPWLVCSRTLGWGLVGSLCRGSSSVAVDSFASGLFGGNDGLVGTVAHELGHNFGMSHDGQTGPASGCRANDGLMGYGSTKDRFSSCSLDAMATYFNHNGRGLQCLGTGWDSDDEVASNVDENGGRLHNCDGVDCVYISGLPEEHRKHEGYYTPTYDNDCHDDHSYYNGPNGQYLCYDGAVSRWYLTMTVCSDPFAISSATGGDVLSTTTWAGLLEVDDKRYFAVMDSVRISDCNGNQAFSEDLECLESNPLDDEICVSTAGSLFDGDLTFLVLGDLCLNEQPVYHFMARNHSEIVEYDNFTVEEVVVGAEYFIHYELVPLDVTSNETVGQWMLSQDEISANYLAFCEEQELRDCTAGSWTVQTLFLPEAESYSEDSDSAEIEVNQTIAEVAGGGFVEDVLDGLMTVRDGNCAASYVYDQHSGDGDGAQLAMLAAVILAVVMVAMICAAPFLVRKFVSGADGKQSVPDAEEADAVEVEVEIAETGNGKTGLITNTRD